MDNTAVRDLTGQYKHAFRILVEEINRFNETDWLQGISAFQTPVKQAMHILDCLDFYSLEDTGQAYTWGHRFGGGWWELPADHLPNQKALIEYACELEARIVKQLALLNDDDLLKLRAEAADDQLTVIGHHVYALKHTLHHHGQLAALSVYHGHAGGSWD